MGLGGFIGNLFGDDNRAGSAYGAGPSFETVENARNMHRNASLYRQNLPHYVQDASNLNEEQAANEAYNQDKQINASMNNRGLLFSGLNQGAKQGNRSAIASALMRKRAGLNKSAEDTAFGMENDAAGAGLSVANLYQQGANQRYRGDLGSAQQDPGLLGGFIEGFI